MVRRAWWDAILKCYEHSYKSPQRLPLEMRIMGDSNVVMAPQRGNKFGTCSIEILTLEDVKDLWNDYAQDVLNKWMSYTDRDGNKLKTRPHWAKQWVQSQVDGKPWKEKLREDYNDEIIEFKGLLAAIGKDHGWTLADLKKRFSNDLFDDFYFGDVVVKEEKVL
jgi:D-arabinono-1,4-lactone oxidase